MSWLSCNLSVTMLLVISIRFSSVPILGCLVLISNVIRNRHSQTSLLVRDIRRISPGCHLQSSVCKHPSPVSVIRRVLISLFIGYFFCMRFSRYVFFVTACFISHLKPKSLLILNHWSNQLSQQHFPADWVNSSFLLGMVLIPCPSR